MNYMNAQGRHEAAAPLPQPAPLLVPKPKEHPLDLSDDLPGLGSPVVTPSIGEPSSCFVLFVVSPLGIWCTMHEAP